MLGTEPEIKSNYVASGQVKLVFNPILDFGEPSLQAAQAAACAGEQGQFWPMHDLLFSFQDQLWGDTREAVKELAMRLDIDHNQFNTCIDEQRYAELVQSQNQHRLELGIRTRPTLDVNGQFIVGAQPFASFEAVIEPMLTQ